MAALARSEAAWARHGTASRRLLKLGLIAAFTTARAADLSAVALRLKRRAAILRESGVLVGRVLQGQRGALHDRPQHKA